MKATLLDVTRLLDRRLQRRLPTGIDRVSLEYVRHFGPRSTALVHLAGQWIELSANDSARLFGGLLSEPADSRRFNALIVWLVARALPRSTCVRLSSSRFLLNTGHAGLEQARYAHFLHRSPLRPVFFVHDLIPLSYPEYCRPGESTRHRIRMQTVLSTGHAVILNSQATLDAMRHYAAEHHQPMPPAVVAPLAPPQWPRADSHPPLRPPYFVMLGTIEPRKNHWLILHVWRQLIERMGAAAPRLLVVGQHGWECENVVDMLERCEVLRGFVFERPGCSDAELATCLQHAQALLFPSFAEGYGMPLVEALALGLPVIASDLPAFREIGATVPEYVDPLDGRRWADLIVDYASPESPCRRAQLQRLESFVAPTWPAHFAQVEALLERLDNLRGQYTN
ncbi:MAG TPA: glycosyltransferase family 1 protein [Candidatus Accumulibacter phosphatis]|nr:MAG: putative glycosyl transferase [Candidatus Accumulibacter sp. SK-11]HAY25984.1 glycosyltransferase family 1 protein [Accumulibacter sp.]HRL75890.1 glycosyltransferase family 1 protein [Candidatus Accumulibacter phosphatis]HCN70008.1 glycosyltransferase family 1 protein [Accumulibacter sp.]HCV14468.1 glycosyltransferase family 1 protein [Accumulibacter sp.]